MRLNVWVPDELVEVTRSKFPDLNVSKLVQQALRDLVGCAHERLECAACAAPVARSDVIDAALCEFYREAIHKLEPLVHAVGTAEGACRVLEGVGKRWVEAGDFPRLRELVRHTALPRPSKSQREAARPWCRQCGAVCEPGSR